MAHKVEWTLGAFEDLDLYTAYIANDSKIHADKFNMSVLAASFSLDTLYHRGRIVPEIGDSDIRELILGTYRLLYRIEVKSVRILALIHGAKDLKKEWKRRNG